MMQKACTHVAWAATIPVCRVSRATAELSSPSRHERPSDYHTQTLLFCCLMEGGHVRLQPHIGSLHEGHAVMQMPAAATDPHRIWKARRLLCSCCWSKTDRCSRCGAGSASTAQSPPSDATVGVADCARRCLDCVKTCASCCQHNRVAHHCFSARPRCFTLSDPHFSFS